MRNNTAEANVAGNPDNAAALPDHKAGIARTRARLRSTIERAVHLLPSQGPLTVFIHHNPLHAFEDLPFARAVVEAGRVYGCEPFLAEVEYRRHLASGRIRAKDLAAELLDDLGESADDLLGFLGTRFQFRLAMLRHQLVTGSPAELRWLIAETGALRRFREDTPPEARLRVLSEFRRRAMRGMRPPTQANPAGLSTPWAMSDGCVPQYPAECWSDADWEAVYLNALFRVCQQGVSRVLQAPTRQPRRTWLRELLLERTGEDSDALVNAVLIRFCAAFLDQGYSHWPLPERDKGFLHAFAAVYGRGCVAAPWLEGLQAMLSAAREGGDEALQSIDESLVELGILDDEREDFLRSTLLALRGWAGLLWQMETNAEWTPHPAPAGSLIEYLAVRLMLSRLAHGALARQHLGFTGRLRDLRAVLEPARRDSADDASSHRAFQFYQLAQLLGWSSEDLARLLPVEWSRLMAEVEEFDELARRRVFHAAYERQYRTATLDAIALRAEARRGRPEAPGFQLIACIDEREESFRRHLEEVAPECETFGAAGFFGVAMYYRGAADAHYVPLCPIIIKPRHYVREQVAFTHEQSGRRRAAARRTLGAASHRWSAGSRTFWAGIVTSLAGSAAVLPLVGRVLLPRATAQLRGVVGRFLRPPPATRLELERTEAAPGADPGHVGYTLDEMTDIVERVLRDIGLTRNFARLVIVCGHGSNSLNNPHEAAHDCGACGGARGGPNARAFAQMANSKRVREGLSRRGLSIPAQTAFVGAYHNTCDDSMQYFDLERLPATHAQEFLAARDALDRARERNAHERCRRFESASLALSAEAALRHVEARAEDLSQTRPEYGHATNAVCVVGRRALTRRLFCDRRAFLASYDPAQDDPEHSILARILSAVIPVCAGISLEYYFSFVDPGGYGCGTKLPHNLTSLLGVMDGAASDMRPGLPWQMVEIHEPMRLLFVIESTPEAMLSIMDRNAVIGRLCRNQWVQVATIDPCGSSLFLFRNGAFEPYAPESRELPAAPSSSDWYRGWRDHLGYAVVGDDGTYCPRRPAAAESAP